MQTYYEVFLTDVKGNRICPLATYSQLQWSKVLNGVGKFWLLFPPGGFDRKLYLRERRVEIMRHAGMKPETVMIGFLRQIKRWQSSGQSYIGIGGSDANVLLNRRIVYATAGSAGATKTAAADNVMKAFVRENLGSLAAAARDLTSAGFTVQTDVGLGPSITKSAAYGNLLRVLQEITVLSAAKGTRILFQVDMPQPNTFEFRTYAGQLGLDRTVGSNPLIMSAENGRLYDASLEEDAEAETNYVYVGGEGVEADRKIEPLEDTARSLLGPFARCESFVDASSSASASSLADIAAQALREGRPKILLQGKIRNLEGNQYGIDWNLGDKVYGGFDVERYPCEIASVSCSYAQGKEDIQAEISYVG